MQTMKRLLFSLLAVVLFSGVALSVPAAAIDNPPVSEVENHARDLMEQFKAQAQTTVADKKAQVTAKTQEQRQKACEARKANITRRMSKAVAQAEKHKAVFDKIYSKVQAFKTKKNLDVANYDNLIATTDQAQNDAEASITALKELDISVDCSSETVAQSLASFQSAVKSSRDSLKAYRESIVSFMKPVKAAVPEKIEAQQ